MVVINIGIKIWPQIGSFFHFPRSCTGLVANMILYYASDSMITELAESEKVLCHFQEAQQLTQMGCNHLDRTVMDKVSFNIHLFFHALTQMKNLFGTCKIQSGDNNDSSVPRTLEINITETEETWLKKRFCMFQEQVSISPTFYKQLFLTKGFRAAFLN